MKQLVTHLYEPDRDAPADHRGEHPCIHCPLPRGNRAHRLPDVTREQAEHRRRAGEED